MKKRIFTAVLMLLFLFTQFAFASVSKEYTFTTTNSDYEKLTVEDLAKGDLKDIPKEIKNGRFRISEATGITFTLKSKVEPEEVIYENLIEKVLPEDTDTIKKDGETLKLVDTEWESVDRTAVTGTRTLKGYDTQPEFPATKEVTATLADGKTITATCRLKSVKQTGSSYSKPWSVTGKFIGDPDVSYYSLNGKLIPNNPASPAFSGYESTILEHFGLSADSYKISSAEWTSDYIEEDGQTVRYAKFSGTRKSKDWTAYYEETITDSSPNLKVYTATCKYGSADTVYTVTANVSYDKSRFSTFGIVAISCAAIVIVAAMAVLLCIKLRKKDDEESEG